MINTISSTFITAEAGVNHTGKESLASELVETAARQRAAAVVLPGVFVGQGCIIGAGSAVVSDIPAFSTIIGVPGRIVQKKN